MPTVKVTPASTVAEQTQQIHDCLQKLVEIKLILVNIPEPGSPKENLWLLNEVGEHWSKLRTNLAEIYVDFLELSHE